MAGFAGGAWVASMATGKIRPVVRAVSAAMNRQERSETQAV